MSIEIKEEKNPKIDVILNVALNVTLVSDLHREFYRHSTPLFDTLRMELLPQTRICVMAGDVGYPLLRRSEGYSPDPSFIHILKEFKKRYPVVLFVPGNHEYYQAQEYKASMDKIDQVMKRACEEAKVIFLNCNTWMDEETNCEFIGCTLWSLMSQQTWLKMNDSKVFSNVDSLNEKHISHVKWLTQTLTKTDSVGSMPTKRIVITHHLPSFQMVHPKFTMSTINDGFCSNLEYLLQDKSLNKISMWLCGHTHEYVQKVIHNVVVVCNPLGYPKESRQTEFRREAISMQL